MAHPGVPIVCIACVAATACVNISATDSRYIEREEQRFSVTGTPDLTLDTFDGSIEVRSWDRQEVLVVAEKRGFDRDDVADIQINSRQDGDRIVFEAREQHARNYDTGFRHGRSARLIVTVPAVSTIRAQSGDGSVDIADVEGELTVETGDGGVRLDAVRGDVNLRSGDGRIHVSGRLFRVRARSGDGSVTVRAESGSEARQDWDIATGDGPVTIELPADFNAELDAHTGDGRVTLRDLALSAGGGSRQRETLRGTLNQGGSTVHVRSGDGSIIVRGS